MNEPAENGEGQRPARLLSAGVQSLQATGLVSPRADARILLAYAAGLEPAELAATRRLNAEVARKYITLIERRAAGEPVQYLTGEAWFRRLQLRVGPGVFIPRPETELLVHFGLERLAMQPPVGDQNAPIVVDLGTGSGAVAAAILDEAKPSPRVYAVENSAEALPWAHLNLDDTAATIVPADLADALPELNARVFLVVSNPPYIPVLGAQLPVDVYGHEPASALYGGPDGLDVIAAVVRTAARLLAPGGWLAIEHDDTHGESAPALVKSSGAFEIIEDHRDLTGRARFVTAHRVAGR